MKQTQFKRIISIIFSDRWLRIAVLLSISFIILGIVFGFLWTSYRSQAQRNMDETQKNELALMNLQKLALNGQDGQGTAINLDIFQNKSFADYEEVIPFIAFLEKLFFSLDPFAEVAIKSREDQIFLDHFADYSVKAKISDKNILFQALNDLYDSRFITKITDFNLHYKTGSEEKAAHLAEASLTLRLYLK